MSAKEQADFNRLMKLIDATLDQLQKATKVHDKQTLRHMIDEMLTKVDPTGLNAKQLERIDEKRKRLDAALAQHERGN